MWEVIAAARSAPERGEPLIDTLAQRTGVPADKVRIAVRYYAEYPDEIDRWVRFVDEVAERLERTLARERSLLA